MFFSIYLYAGDSSRGLTYYKYILKPIFGYNGSVFTKKYTKEQWKLLYKDNAKEFTSLFSENNQSFLTFSKSEKYKKILPDLEAFSLEYSKNSGTVAICEEE